MGVQSTYETTELDRSRGFCSTLVNIVKYVQKCRSYKFHKRFGISGPTAGFDSILDYLFDALEGVDLLYQAMVSRMLRIPTMVRRKVVRELLKKIPHTRVHGHAKLYKYNDVGDFSFEIGVDRVYTRLMKNVGMLKLKDNI